MELTTQAAIVSALLALLVLLGGLALRDRRRRRAGSERDLEAVLGVYDVPEQPEDHENPVEDPEVEVQDVEVPVQAPTYDEPVLDAPVPVDEPVDEPVLDEQPVLPEPVAPRGWWARRRARRRARRLGKAFDELVAPADADEVLEPPVEERLEDEQPVDAEAALEHVALVEDALADAADQIAEQEPDAPESPEQAELRDLRARVRVLEGTLLAQLAETPTDLALVPTPGGEPTEAYLRQISLVVRGLAEHTDEAENPHRTLARVAAAVERLGVPNGMDRPALPLPSDPPPHPRATGPWQPSHRLEVRELEAPAGASQGEVVPFPGAVGTLVEELVNVYSHGEVQVSPQVAELAAPVEAMPQPIAQQLPEPVVEPMAEPTQAMELPEPDQAPPTYDAAEVVLPVPPPARSQPQTTRRRFRR